MEASVPAVPRPAATVILLRDADPAPEVLMVQRTPHARFMANAWVFPGGALAEADRVDEDADDAVVSALRNAAVRECAEEAGIRLPDPAALRLFSRWITPEQVRIRFDTYFFIARAPDGQTPVVDGQEIVAHRWITPEQALAAHQQDAMSIVFPTLKHLEAIQPFGTVEEILDHAAAKAVRPVIPVVIEGDGTSGTFQPRIVLAAQDPDFRDEGPDGTALRPGD